MGYADAGEMMTPEEKAKVSKDRGMAAAKMPSGTPAEQKSKMDYIAKQGNEEMKHGGQMSRVKGNKLDQESALPSYKKGTSFVPKTGPAMLHKGEAVVPKHEADKHRMYGLAAHVMGGMDHTPEKELKEIRIRKGASGGHVIEHHHKSPEYHPSEEHVTGSMKDLQAHLEQHLGSPEEGQDSEAGSESPQAEVTA